MGSSSANSEPPESLPVALRPLRTIPSGRNVPRPRTSLIGRENEIARIVGLLKTGNIRLLTVTGTGGSGKTRVAIEVARELETAFEDGAFFSRAPVGDAEAVVETISGGEETILLPGDSVFEQNIVHSAQNEGDVQTVVYIAALSPTGEPFTHFMEPSE